MHLSWQPGFSPSRKPVRRSIARRIKGGVSGNADGSQQFEFIAEQPVRNPGPRHSLSVTTSTDSGAPITITTDGQTSPDLNGIDLSLANCSKNQYSIVSDEFGANSQIEVVEVIRPSLKAPLWGLSDITLVDSGESPDSATTNETIDLRPYPCNNEDRCVFFISDGQMQIYEGSDINVDTFYKRSSRTAAVKPVPAAISDLINVSRSPSASIPPSILYNSLSQRFRPILDRYDQEFCKIPLTSDLRINPFRCRTDLDSEPIFLVHAVMALAGHHVKSTSTQNHRHAALQLLRKSLDTYGNAGAYVPMLDSIIILFSLDETQSALGNWSTHLEGAYNLLEACGGIEVWATSARAEVQVGMLTWWDAITSLVSREACVFPYTYCEAVLSNHNARQWDYFGLCGCPPSLVKIVMQLARLSAEKRQSSSMQYVKFDISVISNIEHSLESWQHISPPTSFRDEECLQQDQDSMHCSEAWRNGLLLYVYRIFRWEPGSSIPIPILHRARVIIDHVFACRDESMISRQALLPLFFAGCELRDPSLRKKIAKFCSIWNERTRYHMFNSTVPLLEEVWAEQEAKSFENVWWGQVVDKQHMFESRYPLQRRLCFG